MRPSPRLPLLILALASLSLPVRTASCAVAKAGSGFFASRTATSSDSASWRFSTPDFGDLMIWTSGENHADGTLFPQIGDPIWTEFKFNLLIPPTGKTLAGFGPRNDLGGWGSVATTSGSGASVAIPGTLWGTNYTVSWQVTATGSRGPASLTSWDSRAEGRDPFSVTPAKLAQAGITGSQYDLYFPAELSGGSHLGVSGSLKLRAFYDDAAGSTKLLDISADSSGVTVTSDNPPGVSYYLLSSTAEGPTEVAANQVSLATIQSMIAADLATDAILNNSVSVGIVLDNLPVPTVDLGDGSVAKIRVETEANDHDGGPDDCLCDTLSSPWMTGADVTFELDAGPAYAGRRYLILGSLTGISPGFPLPGGQVVLPINWDAFSSLTLSLADSPILPTAFALLDAEGRSTSGFNTYGPLPPSAVGLAVNFAYALTQPFDYASSPVTLLIGN